MRKWNNDKIQHDAVPTGSNFVAGDYYLLNLRNADMKAAMTGIIDYKGTPAPEPYHATGKSVIPSMSESEFSNADYNNWKTKVNEYNEDYQSYMGRINPAYPLLYGKNVYRFGNPYTSNIDLSVVDGPGAWLHILNGGSATIEGATGVSIMDFYITKRTDDYDIDWNPTSGSSNVNADYYKAMYDGTQWVGSGNALIVKPLETFNLNFPIINPTALGGRIIEVAVDFNDSHKTFSFSPGQTVTNGVVPYGVANSSNNLTSRAVASTDRQISAPVSNASDFYQAEIFLVKDNVVEAAPVYLVGANYYQASGDASDASGKIFLYGSKEENGQGEIVYNSKKDFNTFNSMSYIAKPLGIGFNSLDEGANYELRFNLYEGSIFNKVKDLSNGQFYLYDNATKKSTEISSAQSYQFTASGDVSDRFVVYWKDMPQALGTNEDAPLSRSETVIYKDRDLNKLRFEKAAPKAKVEIYDMSGRLINASDNISTTPDYTLPLTQEGVYIIRVIYNNGEIRSLKAIK